MRGIDPNLALVMIFVLACLGFIALPACTPTATVQHTAPQLDAASDSIRKTSDSIRLAVDKMASAPMQCPTLEMPPIPRECVIDIRGTAARPSRKPKRRNRHGLTHAPWPSADLTYQGG